MADVWSTHRVELLPDRVVKRYRRWGEREHEREWQALTLLQAHAPGLAPAPLDLDRAFPAVVMSRLPGTVLRGGIVEPAQISALAAAVTQLHHSVPPAVARIAIIDFEESGRSDIPYELAALVWLIALSLVGPGDDRNPPDTPLRQAQRLGALLDSGSVAVQPAWSGICRENLAAGCRDPVGGSVPAANTATVGRTSSRRT